MTRLKRTLAMAALVVVGAIPGLAGAQTLSGAEWQVASLQGGPLPEGVVPTISFQDDGRFAGHSGCNRYMGGWTQDGSRLTLTQVAGTMMACDEARMTVERRMFEALAAVTTVALTPGGALELLGAEGLLIRATR